MEKEEKLGYMIHKKHKEEDSFIKTRVFSFVK